MNQTHVEKIGIRLDSTLTSNGEEPSEIQNWITGAESIEAGWHMTEKAQWYVLAAPPLTFDGTEETVPGCIASYVEYTDEEVNTVSSTMVIKRFGHPVPVRIRFDVVLFGRFGQLSRTPQEYEIAAGDTEVAIADLTAPSAEAIADGALNGTRPYALIRLENFCVVNPTVNTW